MTARGPAIGWAGAVLIASALCAVLATRVFVSFERVRSKVVRESITAVDGRVRVESISDPRLATLAAPVAVVAVLRNSGSAAEPLTIHANGQRICDVSIEAHKVSRVDCMALVGWERRADHVIEVAGASREWSLESLEIATHHGATTRAVQLLVLPGAAARFERPGVASIAIAWLLIAGLFLLPPASNWHRGWTRLHRVLSGTTILVLAVTVVSPWWSPFLVVASLSTFVKAAMVLGARRLWRVGTVLREMVRGVLAQHHHWRPMVPVFAVPAVVALAGFAFVQHTASEFDGNYSGLLRVSERGFDRSPLFAGRADVRATLVLQKDEGYDAQFMYFAAFDPLLRRFRATPEQYRDVTDATPYRFGRIGFPWLVRAVTGGQWAWYPAAMVGLVLAGMVLSAFVLGRLAAGVGVSAYWGLIVMAVPGFWASLTMILPEPLAAAFLLLGYWWAGQRRIALAVFAFALSLLIRETGVVFLLAVAFLAQVPGITRRDRIWLVSSVLPVLVWRGYAAMTLWPVWGWDALFYPAPTITLPLAGLLSLWSVLMRGEYHPHVPELARAAIWFSVLLIAVAMLAAGVFRAAGRFIGATFAAYALMALSFTYPIVWGHVANAQRASYEAFVMLALASLGIRRYPRHLQAAIVACWTGAVLFILFGAHDAFVIWDALFAWV